MAERNLCSAVLGDNVSVLIEHGVCVSVIGSQEDLPVLSEDGFCDLTYETVECLDRLYCRIEYTGVAYHVRVGEVKDDQVVCAFVDLLDDCACYERCAHLRLQVVCRYLR